jgi:triacylglycerol lipase
MTPATTLILDGIWGRPRRFARMRRAIERATEGPTEIFHYDVSGLTPFETLGQRLVDHVRSRGEALNLVAFSMGGIVARTAQLLDPDIPVRRAVFLNSPHAGTILAYSLPFAGVRQLRPNADLIHRLAAATWNIPTLVTWSPLDAIIVPGHSADWPHATQSIRCPVPMHTWPIWSSKIHHRVARFLAAEDEIPTSAMPEATMPQELQL